MVHSSNRSSLTEVMRLVPHSGIQFITLPIDLKAAPQFSRLYIGHKHLKEMRPDGSVPIELLPGWNEDDPEADPPFRATDDDDEYNCKPEGVINTYLNSWIPIPYLGVRPGQDNLGREVLEAGPINWVRAKITKSEADDQSNVAHQIVLAFDTEIEARNKTGYVAPTPDDVRNEREFSFAFRFRDASRFLRGNDNETVSRGSALSWVDRWLFDIFADFRSRLLKRRLRDEEVMTVEHLAQYLTLLEVIAISVEKLPRIRLIDTYSEDRRTKPVNVDLVLDLGNSRTCGVLVETYPNDPESRLDNTIVLGLRDLENPNRVYKDPFESHVELAQAHFGPEYRARETRPRSFFWPSPVRIGPEATRYRDKADGSGRSSGMSSPKRYLCDVAPVNQEWAFQPRDYDASGTSPSIDTAMRRFVNPAGDVRRQVAEEPKLYAQLAQSAGYSDRLDKIALQVTYSRSSMFTLMLTEIIAQTISMINNPQLRAFRKDRDAPRELRSIILSLPTAMPIQEQRIMRSRAMAAVKLVWDLMRWTEAPPPGVKDPPRVNLAWDEATCTQVVYLYNELVHKSGGNIESVFRLVGQERKRVDPDQANAKPEQLKIEPSLRIASVDIGGGTTDLMISTYYIDGGVSLIPVQNFREGFRIAGDEVLREVIQQCVLPAFERSLRAAGVSDARGILASLFASNTASMSIQAQHIRRQFVLRIFEPIALSILKFAEGADAESGTSTYSSSVSKVLSQRDSVQNNASQPTTGAKVPTDDEIPSGVRKFLEDEAKARGAQFFNLQDVIIEVSSLQVRNAVASALNEVFDCISEAIHSLDCDVVLLSGRPSRLPATIELFVDKLGVFPDRVIPMSLYQVGKWYPFAAKASFRIDDPKTATVVGSLLCVLVERQITNFRVDTQHFNMRSTAKFLGKMDMRSRIKNSEVFFRWKSTNPDDISAETSVVSYHTQMQIGYRQIELERWIATPLYRLKIKQGGATERVKGPFSVTLGRRQPEDDIGFGDRKFAENEALKEGLMIREVEAASGGLGGLSRMFTLQLDTLSSDDGYWLDTGILTIA